VGNELTILAATADKATALRVYTGGASANGGQGFRIMHIANKEVIVECPF
jgi:hypothetical protein